MYLTLEMCPNSWVLDVKIEVETLPQFTNIQTISPAV